METLQTIGKLTAYSRQDTGKGVARKLRARGFVPAVCYGSGKKARALKIRPGDLRTRVLLLTNEMQTPVTKEESTRVYSDE